MACTFENLAVTYLSRYRNFQVVSFDPLQRRFDVTIFGLLQHRINNDPPLNLGPPDYCFVRLTRKKKQAKQFDIKKPKPQSAPAMIL